MRSLIFFLLGICSCIVNSQDVEVEILNDSLFYGETPDSVALGYYENKVRVRFHNKSNKTYLIHFDSFTLTTNYQETKPEEDFPFSSHINITNKSDKTRVEDRPVFLNYDYPVLDSMFLLDKQRKALDTVNYMNIDLKDLNFAQKKLAAIKSQLILPRKSFKEFILYISLPELNTHFNTLIPYCYYFLLDKSKKYELSITLFNDRKYLKELYSKKEIRRIEKSGIQFFYGILESNRIPLKNRSLKNQIVRLNSAKKFINNVINEDHGFNITTKTSGVPEDALGSVYWGENSKSLLIRFNGGIRVLIHEVVNVYDIINGVVKYSPFEAGKRTGVGPMSQRRAWQVTFSLRNRDASGISNLSDINNEC